MDNRQFSGLALVAAVTFAPGAWAQQSAKDLSVATIASGSPGSTDPGPPVYQATDLPRLIMEDADGAVPIELAPDNIRHSFHLRVDERSLIQQVLNAYGIQVAMDSSVRSQIVLFDVDDVDFTEASSMVKLVTDTFFVPLDSKRVLAAAGTKANGTQYERQVMETFSFPGLNPNELNDMQNIARIVFGAERSVEIGRA